jgi:hypothetical protein
VSVRARTIEAAAGLSRRATTRYTAPEYSGGGDGKNWLHVVAHLVIAVVVLPLVSWGVSSLVMLVTKKVAPRAA